MDTAIRWWLGSVHNNSKVTNQYTRVTLYGNRTDEPWADPGAARFIANELRYCRFVGLGLSWAGGVPWDCNQLHVVTAWGDSGDDSLFAEGINPDSVIIADSDNEMDGPDDNLRTYQYDDYFDPQEPNEGEGWYLNGYDVYPVHPYVMNVTTLSRSDTTHQEAVSVTGSYMVQQDSARVATDLRYIVESEEHLKILSYETEISSPDSGEPDIDETGDPPRSLRVDWDSLNVMPAEWVRIHTELVLPKINAIRYDSVYFTYEDEGDSIAGGRKAALEWQIEGYQNPDTLAECVCGGYVTGAFEIFSDSSCSDKIGEYRLSHEYTFEQDPERHDFLLETPDTFYVANLRFGHSYGHIDPDSLWNIDCWMETFPDTFDLRPDNPVAIELSWENMLHYPVDIKRNESPVKPGVHSVFPNPFNPSTTVEYSVPRRCRVNISIYDVSGRRVAVLVDQFKSAGKYRAVWNGVDSEGHPAASGVYFVRLVSGGRSFSRKIVLLK